MANQIEALTQARQDRDYHRRQSQTAMHGSAAAPPPEARAIVDSIDALTHAVRALDLTLEIGQLKTL